MTFPRCNTWDPLEWDSGLACKRPSSSRHSSATAHLAGEEGKPVNHGGLHVSVIRDPALAGHGLEAGLSEGRRRVRHRERRAALARLPPHTVRALTLLAALHVLAPTGTKPAHSAVWPGAGAGL